MFDMKNTYWNKNGKYQRFVDGLEHRTPGHGYTSNVYVNVYLVMAHLYYDAYNNGGGNIQESYAKDFYHRVEPYLGNKVDINAFLNEDFVKMESMMNTAIEFIKDKNLEFPIYSFWCNHDIQTVSDYKPIGELAEKGYWFEATFGEPEELERFKKNWCSKYQSLSRAYNEEAFKYYTSESDIFVSADEVMINVWFNNLLESVGKSSVEELTQKEILVEITEIEGTISNERLWEKGYDGKEPINPHSQNIITLTEYLERLNSLCDKAREKEPSLDDVIKSCESVSKESNKTRKDNEYYKTSDGFFDFYVNRETGVKKFQLEDGDVEVEQKVDDFSRREER